jgi:hypothetical protein
MEECIGGGFQSHRPVTDGTFVKQSQTFLSFSALLALQEIITESDLSPVLMTNPTPPMHPVVPASPLSTHKAPPIAFSDHRHHSTPQTGELPLTLSTTLIIGVLFYWPNSADLYLIT